MSLSSSTQQTNSSQSTGPWGPQAGTLEQAFADAMNQYQKASGMNAPANFTAQMTPQQLQTYKSMLGYGGANMGNATGVQDTGMNMMGTGANAASGALTSLGGFNPAASNNPADLIKSATQFAQGQNIPAQVKAAMQQGVETARDVTLPGMESAAAGNGNINSSRTGLQEGIVQRGLGEQAANLNNSLMGQAFGNGLNLAENQASTNNAQTLQGLNTAGAIGTNLAANGAAGVGQGINDANGLYALMQGGGAGLQQNNQLGLTNALQKYQAGVSSPFDALNGLMNIIGSRSWGSESNGSSTTTSTPSWMQSIGGILSAF
jgi:hypothetical protein